MKKETVFLKTIVILLGLPVLLICIYGLSRFDPNSPYWASQELASLQYPILLGMYVAMIPFFVALYQTLKLLTYIDRNEAFSTLSVHAVTIIKYCAIIATAVFLIEMPFLYRLTRVDDAPGILIGAVVIFASTVTAVFTTILQKLLQRAIEMKKENDLTI